MDNMEKKMSGSSPQEKIAKALAAILATAPMAESPQPAEAQTIQRSYGDDRPNVYRSPDGKVYQESHGPGSPNIDRGASRGPVHQESHGKNSPNVSGVKGDVIINGGDVTITGE